MLWLAVPLSGHPVTVVPQGGQLAFPCCHGKGSSEGRGCGGAGGGACSSLPLHYMWLTYFSGAKWRQRESWEEYRAKSQADSGPLVSRAGCVIA